MVKLGLKMPHTYFTWQESFYAYWSQPTGPTVRLASSVGSHRPSTSSDDCCCQGRTRTGEATILLDLGTYPALHPPDSCLSFQAVNIVQLMGHVAHNHWYRWGTRTLIIAAPGRLCYHYTNRYSLLPTCVFHVAYRVISYGACTWAGFLIECNE